MRISDLAARAGVTVKAVRYYESQGLLKPEREANGYRTYGDHDVVVVREVKALLSLGLTAEQTYPFIECLRAGNDRADVCPASLTAYRTRIAEVDARIAELSDLRAKLTELLADAESWRKRGSGVPTMETRN
ncbi:MerR family transcriptional regulator [Kribbella sp. NBC_01245]|uniref:MerR family transcriptional regulator n=1 Tax=Kribbella sp. NBC_01245 TaxID=2903578 RepID=UPI002E2B6B2D|nr:MerR family transcriptional regulator [Kribbella sp. NBC_01245]